jgi:release factor glutamine methyltransferase
MRRGGWRTADDGNVMGAGVTLREVQAESARRLGERAELREQAGRDAEYLLLWALGAGRTELFARPERVLTRDEVGRVEAAIGRRLTLEPVQYITGVQEFYGLEFRVTPATLIPRPETELLVEAVLERVPRGREVRIVDVGTGSGAIAVALAVRVPRARVVAVDLSEAALEIARENAGAHGVGERIEFLRSDLLGGVAGGEFDVVVSNPPYIPEGDRAGLHAQVREFEPATALFAGNDGLEVYRRLIPQAWERLGGGGLLAMEMGFGQTEALREMLAGWGGVAVLDDLAGIGRVVVARKV